MHNMCCQSWSLYLLHTITAAASSFCILKCQWQMVIQNDQFKPDHLQHHRLNGSSSLLNSDRKGQISISSNTEPHCFASATGDSQGGRVHTSITWLAICTAAVLAITGQPLQSLHNILSAIIFNNHLIWTKNALDLSWNHLIQFTWGTTEVLLISK